MSLVVEVDGHEHHSSPDAQARDTSLDRRIESADDVDQWFAWRFAARDVLRVRSCDVAVREIHKHLARWTGGKLARAAVMPPLREVG